MTDRAPGLDWTRFEDAHPAYGCVVEIRRRRPHVDRVRRWSNDSVPTYSDEAWRYPPVPAVQREEIRRQVEDEHLAFLWAEYGDADPETLTEGAQRLRDALRRAAGPPVPGEGVGDE